MRSDESSAMLHIAAVVMDNQAIVMGGLSAIAAMCAPTSTDGQREALDKLQDNLSERVREMTELAENLRRSADEF